MCARHFSNVCSTPRCPQTRICVSLSRVQHSSSVSSRVPNTDEVYVEVCPILNKCLEVCLTLLMCVQVPSNADMCLAFSQHSSSVPNTDKVCPRVCPAPLECMLKCFEHPSSVSNTHRWGRCPQTRTCVSPSRSRSSKSQQKAGTPAGRHSSGKQRLQGYLAQKKHPPP